MRELQFPLALKTGGVACLLVSVDTGFSHTVGEFIADDFITRSMP